MKRITRCTSLIRENYYIWDRYMSKCLSGYNLNMTELYIIQEIYDAEDQTRTFKEIENCVKISQSVVVRMLKGLEKDGFITISSDKKDKRVKRAGLTMKGQQFANVTKKMLAASDYTLLKDFTEHEKIQFERFLLRCLDNSIQKSNKKDAKQEPEYNVEDYKIAILNVDDEEINRDILKDFLEEDYIVDSASNGEDALKMLLENTNRYSLVLLDLQMPKMDGITVLEKINEYPQLSKIPIIVVTSEHSSEVEDTCFKLGVRDFITKPYNYRIIRHRVRNVIEIFRYQRILEREIDQ